MKVKQKRLVYLVTDTIRPSVSGINLFNETLKSDYSVDPVTGEKYPIFRWTQIVSNASQKTGNGNIFSKQDVAPAIEDMFVQERLKNKTFYNEFRHPTRDNPERYLQVYDDFVSDRINKFWWETLNGDDVLLAECETSIFSYGPELRKKIISGSVPAKSLRGAGEVYTDSSGRERKNMRIVCYDNVFMPADRFAWANMNTMQKDMYAASLVSQCNKEEIDSGMANVKSLYAASVIDLGNRFEEIMVDKQLIQESLGFEVDKAMVDVNRNVIAYYGESVTVKTELNKHLHTAVKSFLKI